MQAYNNPYQPYQSAQPAYSQVPVSNSFYTVPVNGEEGANAYPVASGNTVMLIDFNLNKFWLKTTSPNGIPQPLRSFPFKEETPVPKIQNGDEFDVLSQKIEALKERVDQLVKDLGGKD